MRRCASGCASYGATRRVQCQSAAPKHDPEPEAANSLGWMLHSAIKFLAWCCAISWSPFARNPMRLEETTESAVVATVAKINAAATTSTNVNPRLRCTLFSAVLIHLPATTFSKLSLCSPVKASISNSAQRRAPKHSLNSHSHHAGCAGTAIVHGADAGGCFVVAGPVTL